MEECEFPFHKASLHITHNEHKTNYESIEEYTGEISREELSINERAKCIENDSIWELQVYKHTPIGFYKIYSSTFNGLFENLDSDDFKDK